MRFPANLPTPRFYQGSWETWAEEFRAKMLEFFRQQGEAPVLPRFAKANLPSAAQSGTLVWVTDDVTGAQVAVANGTAWERVRDGTLVA